MKHKHWAYRLSAECNGSKARSLHQADCQQFWLESESRAFKTIRSLENALAADDGETVSQSLMCHGH